MRERASMARSLGPPSFSALDYLRSTVPSKYCSIVSGGGRGWRSAAEIRRQKGGRSCRCFWGNDYGVRSTSYIMYSSRAEKSREEGEATSLISSISPYVRLRSLFLKHATHQAALATARHLALDRRLLFLAQLMTIMSIRVRGCGLWDAGKEKTARSRVVNCHFPAFYRQHPYPYLFVHSNQSPCLFLLFPFPFSVDLSSSRPL